VVALSMACLAAVRGQGESTYPADLSWVNGPDADADADAAAAAAFLQMRFQRHIGLL